MNQRTMIKFEIKLNHIRLCLVELTFVEFLILDTAKSK